jgi:Tlde1 domain
MFLQLYAGCRFAASGTVDSVLSFQACCQRGGGALFGEARDVMPGVSRTCGSSARGIAEVCNLLTRNPAAQTVLDGAAIVSIALLCAWMICAILPQPGGGDDAAVEEAAAVKEAAAPRSDPQPALFNARYYMGFRRERALISAAVEREASTAAWLPQTALPTALEAPPLLVRTALEVPPTAPAPRVALNVPPLRLYPSSRRSAHDRRPSLRADAQRDDVAAEVSPRDSTPIRHRSIFERLFGKPSSSIFEKLYGPRPAGVQLAYATSDTAVSNDETSITTGLYDRHTAVYDISAHTVYLPDGTTLEAHSGRGEGRDNPRYVDARARGPTPPDVYTLRPRERLFHGISALRLVPEDRTKLFGRDGFLAHTYMLGPDGDSFGCVSFRHYEAFLRAYEDHEITKLAVVARID